MKLIDILKQLDMAYSVTDHDLNSKLDIHTLFVDSREKVKNGLFFCIKGLTHDSHKYIGQAIENGAVAIFYSENIEGVIQKNSHIAFIKTEDSRLALAKIAEIFNHFPSHKLRVYGVTGTNGKTSVSYLIYKILSKFEKSAYNGTYGTMIIDEKAPYTYLTTPNTLDLVEVFKKAVDKSCDSISIEVSSHALDMKRTGGIDFDIGIFTNLSRDHLDYHGTMEAYRDAKAELFINLKEDGLAIINQDDKEAAFFKNACGSTRYVTYGSGENADYRFDNLTLNPNGTMFDLIHNGERYQVKTNLISQINVYNLLASIATIHQGGKDLKELVKQVENIDFNIGRFQYVASSKYSIIVDFAHTPDAFEKIFAFTDEFRKKGKRVISVFGSAGERDKGKRPIMGEIAERHSDLIILTEDDNRSESSLQIAKEISQGIGDKSKFIIEENRKNAIKLAFEKAEKGDLILLLGKAVDRIMYRDKYIEEYEGDDVIASKFAEM